MRELLQQALDVIIELYNERGEVCEQNKNLFVEADETIRALEAELAKPEQAEKQEPDLPPVGIGVDVTAQGATVVGFYRRPNAVSKMFYSEFHPSPPRKEWVGLTDEEIKELLDCGRGGLVDIKKAEQMLKEKNT